MIGQPPLFLGGLHLKSMQVDELSIMSTGPRGGVGLSVGRIIIKNNTSAHIYLLMCTLRTCRCQDAQT